MSNAGTASTGRSAAVGRERRSGSSTHTETG